MDSFFENKYDNNSNLSSSIIEDKKDENSNIRMRSFSLDGFSSSKQKQQRQQRQQQQQQQQQCAAQQSSRHGIDVIDAPLITVDNLILRCKNENGKHVPLEILSYNQVVDYLRKINYKEYVRRSNLKPVVSRRFSSKGKSSSAKPKDESALEKSGSIPHPHPWNRKQRSPSPTQPTIRKSTVKLPLASSVLLEISLEAMYNYNKSPKKPAADRSEKEKQYETQMKWVGMQEKHDYVAVEKLKSSEEFEILLKVLMNCKSPTLVQIKLHKDDSISVIYQFIEDFRQQYMVLMIDAKYCLFLEPF